MNKRIKLSIAGVLLLAALAFGVDYYRQESRYDRLVFKIIETPQRYGGSAVDDLVALGPEAVGAIGRALAKGVEFPSTLVMALDRIGSERGMDSLLEFLEKQAPYSENYPGLDSMTILAVRGVGNRDACEPLRVIFHDETAAPEARLSAARSIADLCESEEARNFILDAYDGHNRSNTDRGTQGIIFGTLVEALINLNDDESDARLLELLAGWYAYPDPVVEHLSTRGGQGVADGLLNLVGNTRYDYPHRLVAVRALVELDAHPQSVLQAITTDYALEAEAQWQELPALVEEARRLRAQVE